MSPDLLSPEDRRLAAARELPRLPVLNDSTLLSALADAELEQRQMDHGSPFGGRLPTAAQLVARAIWDAPPTELHLQFQRHVGNALSGLAFAAGSVAAAAGTLSPHNAFSAFRQVAVSSSDRGVVEGEAFAGARSASYAMNIVRLASAQENVGELLAGEAPAGLGAGEQTFELRTRVGTKQLAVTFAGAESNEHMLAQLAASINQAALGVVAMLVRPTASTLQLAITTGDSGSSSAFSLIDLDGGLVRVSGASHTVNEAQDAVYILNEVRTTSPRNEVSLQAGKVRLTLRGVSHGVAQTVSVGPNRQALASALAELVSAISQLATIINENRRYLARTLIDDFGAIVDSLRPRLQQIGVNVGGEYEMELNGPAFDYVLDNSPELAESVVTAPDGLAQRIGQFAAEVMSAPVSRFGAPEFIPPMLPRTSHPTPQMILASNTLSALLYAHLFAQGLFINSVF
ncbi:MAG TPA: hypothetical protein VKU60_11320 [Chloroflexota bacterium]|nr:hypothetical protein [Chloroflexota bacterium]